MRDALSSNREPVSKDLLGHLGNRDHLVQLLASRVLLDHQLITHAKVVVRYQKCLHVFGEVLEVRVVLREQRLLQELYALF